MLYATRLHEARDPTSRSTLTVGPIAYQSFTTTKPSPASMLYLCSTRHLAIIRELRLSEDLLFGRLNPAKGASPPISFESSHLAVCDSGTGKTSSPPATCLWLALSHHELRSPARVGHSTDNCESPGSVRSSAGRCDEYDEQRLPVSRQCSIAGLRESTRPAIQRWRPSSEGFHAIVSNRRHTFYK